MSGGLRAANLASIPSGYGSRLISLTLIDGFRFSNAVIVALIPLSSTADELQWASVIVVAFADVGCVAPPVMAAVEAGTAPMTRTAPAKAIAVRNRKRGRGFIVTPFALSRDIRTALNLPGSLDRRAAKKLALTAIRRRVLRPPPPSGAGGCSSRESRSDVR